MRLMLLTRVIPTRNEKFEVIGTDEYSLIIHPDHFQNAMPDLTGLNGSIVVLRNGADIQVKETVGEINMEWTLSRKEGI